MRLPAGTRFGPYQIESLLGAGGMGEVYEALDTTLARRVALKVLSADVAASATRLSRLKREAQMLAALNHANIAAIYGVEERDGVHALILELAEGPTLAHRLERGPLPLTEALAIAIQIAQALEAAHEQGIVHRDLKPSNVALRPDGVVKVLDFGLATALDPARRGQAVEDATVTADMDRVVGTASYVSPELIAGGPADTRADIWAFGCVLFEMLTGARAFAGQEAAQTLVAVASTEPDWSRLPAELPAGVRMAVRACLRKDPRQRLRDIGDVRLMLDGSLEHGAASVRPVTAPTRGHILAAVAAVLVAAAASGLAGWALANRSTAAPALAFEIHAPAGSQFERRTMAPSPTLSPDGRQLAYTALLNGKPVVWVQTVGDVAARPLPGSEDAEFPFWSPDGQFIAFSAAGHLKRLAASGDSAVQDVCECDAVFGGTWSAAGTIVFAGRAGLERVPASGGQPIAVTRLEASQAEFSHRFPSLLPDGRRFLYLVRSQRSDSRGIYLGSLDDPNLKRRVAPDDSNGVYGFVEEGRGLLFFVRDYALLAQAFDPDRAALIGDPIVVTRPAVPGETGRYAAFTVGGRTVAYRRWRPTSNRLLWLDRRGVVVGSVGKEGIDYDYLSLSPDGARVAVALRDWGSGRRDIWLIDTQRPVSEPLTASSPEAGFPLWTPDGRTIVFASTRSGTWNLYQRSVSGEGVEEPFFHDRLGGDARYPRDITRDGRFLLYGNLEDLWLQPLKGDQDARALLAASDGRVSPDGRWLAYTSPGPTDRELYVTSFPTPTFKRRISIAGGWAPQWRQDGKELYFLAADHTLMVAPIKAGPVFAAGPPSPLFRAAFDPDSMAFGTAFVPAPDGQRFLIIDEAADDTPVLSVMMNWTPRPR